MPKYDRELIARMLLGPRVFSPESVAEQARLLREAENLEVDARTVVREVQDGMVMVQKHDLEWIVAHVLDECDGSGPCADLAARRVRALLAAAIDHQQNAAQGGGEK